MLDYGPLVLLRPAPYWNL